MAEPGPTSAILSLVKRLQVFGSRGVRLGGNADVVIQLRSYHTVLTLLERPSLLNDASTSLLYNILGLKRL